MCCYVLWYYTILQLDNRTAAWPRWQNLWWKNTNPETLTVIRHEIIEHLFSDDCEPLQGSLLHWSAASWDRQRMRHRLWCDGLPVGSPAMSVLLLRRGRSGPPLPEKTAHAARPLIGDDGWCCYLLGRVQPLRVIWRHTYHIVSQSYIAYPKTIFLEFWRRRKSKYIIFCPFLLSYY